MLPVEALPNISHLLSGAGRVRKQEAAIIAKMNRIRATNMALQFAILPLASFITFSVVRLPTCQTLPEGSRSCKP